MQFTKPLKFRKHFVLGALAIGVGFFLFYLISTRQISDDPEIKTPEQKRETIFESPRPSTVQSSQPPSQADIEAAITALENLDVTERRDEDVENSGDQTISDTLLTENGDQTPLNYEETRQQRIERIRNSPEYKAFQAKMLEQQLAVDEWNRSVPTPAQDAHIAYMRNPYSVFGMTEAEADEIELSDEQVKFMHEEGKRLHREAQIEAVHLSEVLAEKRRQTRELSRQLRKDLYKDLYKE